MKQVCFILLAVLLLLSCKKENNPSVTVNPPINNPPPAPAKIDYTLSQHSAKPGALLTLTANSKIPKDTAFVTIGSNTVLLSKIDSLQYAFIVPPLSPGFHSLDLKGINASNSPTLAIDSYIPIANPDVAIPQMISDFHKLVDTLKKYNTNNAIPASDFELMHQLVAQVEKNIKTFSAEEKLMVAYGMRSYNLDKRELFPSIVDAGYVAGRLTNSHQDIGEILITEADIAALKAFEAKVMCGGAIAATIAAVAPSNPLLLIPALLLASRYIYLKGVARHEAAQASNIAGYATDDIREESGLGTQANPAAFAGGQSLIQRILCNFRTVQESDVTGPNKTLSEMIVEINQLKEQDNIFEQYYSKLKTVYSNLTGDVVARYEKFVSPVLQTAKKKLASVNPKYIAVTAVSNPKIALAASDDGKGGLELTASANEIEEETSFSYQVTFTQPALNNKVTATQQGKYLAAYKIGQKAFGGVIFYLDNTGRHGLVSALSDVSASTNWYNAITLCNNYVSGGFDDWRLPTINELDKMAKNKTAIGGFSTSCTDSNFGNCSYWSATENGAQFAWNIYFVNDVWFNNYGRDGLARARAIRSF